jgi:hypothetical protein
MTRIRMSQSVRTENQAVTLDLMIDAPGPVLSDSLPIVNAGISLLLYPIDKSVGLVIVALAPFSSDLDIRWGPLGALAGITLPWVTLIPFLLPPRPLADVALDPQVFRELCDRVRSGDGVRAYTELVQECGWEGGFDALHSVRFHDSAP